MVIVPRVLVLSYLVFFLLQTRFGVTECSSQRKATQLTLYTWLTCNVLKTSSRNFSLLYLWIFGWDVPQIMVLFFYNREHCSALNLITPEMSPVTTKKRNKKKKTKSKGLRISAKPVFSAWLLANLHWVSMRLFSDLESALIR